jgi:predicted ATP-grasp superfamily ATP-dependent carboligase
VNNDALAAHISNKNEFVALCNALGIPTLATYPCYSVADFLKIQKTLRRDVPYIVKPMQDRMRLDDQRRRFSVCETMEDLEQAVSEFCQGSNDCEGFQVQQYVDFRKEPVKYYNVTFHIGEGVKEYITTEQIINVSAIHNNIQSLHWGNMSPSAHSLLAKAEGYARQLAQHYYEMGYQGEIGIDFGLRESSMFFLETNARVNNGTRLYYDLNQLGVDPKSAHYLFIRNKLLEHAVPVVQDYSSTGQVALHDRPDSRTLVVARSSQPIERIHSEIHSLAIAAEPVAY